MPDEVKQPPLMQAYLDYLKQLPQGAPKLSFIEYAKALRDMGIEGNPLWRATMKVTIAAEPDQRFPAPRP